MRWTGVRPRVLRDLHERRLRAARDARGELIDGTSDTYYLTADQLGSTDRIVKAASGTVQVAESFTAFGQRRGSDWTGGPSAADLTAIANSTPDGFTGHAMLDGVGLIHMNGRVYDPTVGRFLSVDPLVRDAAASQSWNGYGYVEGRVLSATDPSGWQTVDCPQCVVPIEPSMRTIVVTATRLYALGTIGDFMALWGGWTPHCSPRRRPMRRRRRRSCKGRQLDDNQACHRAPVCSRSPNP